MRRRSFLGVSGLAVLGAMLGWEARAARQAPASGEGPPAAAQQLPTAVLGKTGEVVPLIGFGTAPGGMGLPDDEAVALYNAAVDAGITFMDTAPAYDRGQAQLARVLQERRKEVFLATKTPTAKADEALKMLRENLDTLGVDQVDLVYIHGMGSYDPEQVLAPGGSLAGLREAQKRGWTRYVGFTSHNRPDRCVKILEEAEVDVVMLALNYVDVHTYGFEREVVPAAAKQDAGIIAMKVYAGAKGMSYEKPVPSKLSDHAPHDHHHAFRYALSIPHVDMAVLGMYNKQEIEQNVAWAQKFDAMPAPRMEKMREQGLPIARVWGEHYGPAA